MNPLNEDEIRSRWDKPLTRLLLEVLPKPIDGGHLLQVGYGTGAFTVALIERLSGHGLTIVSEDAPDLASVLGFKTDTRLTLCKEIDPALARAGFASVFGLARNAFDLRPLLRRAVALVAPGGSLLVGGAVRGSFEELFDLFREALERLDLEPALDGLDQIQAELPSAADVQRELERAGLHSVAVKTRTQVHCFQGGSELLAASWLCHLCLDRCLALLPDSAAAMAALDAVERAFAAYFPGGAELTLVLGRIYAERQHCVGSAGTARGALLDRRF